MEKSYFLIQENESFMDRVGRVALRAGAVGALLLSLVVWVTPCAAQAVGDGLVTGNQLATGDANVTGAGSAAAHGLVVRLIDVAYLVATEEAGGDDKAKAAKLEMEERSRESMVPAVDYVDLAPWATGLKLFAAALLVLSGALAVFALLRRRRARAAARETA